MKSRSPAPSLRSVIFTALLFCAAGGVAQTSPGSEPAAVLLLMERVTDWQLAHPPTYRVTDWRAGACWTGMMALANLGANTKYCDAMLEMGEANAWKLGPKKYFADDYCVGQTYAELYLQHHEPRMIEPMRVQFDDILARPAENPDDLDFSKPRATDKWSWCDALFMGPPGWVMAGLARVLQYLPKDHPTRPRFLA